MCCWLSFVSPSGGPFHSTVIIVGRVRFSSLTVKGVVTAVWLAGISLAATGCGRRSWAGEQRVFVEDS